MSVVPVALALAGLLAGAPARAAEEARVPPELLVPVEGRPPAPALRLDTLDGGPVGLGDGAEGAPATIVHFFATWCAPCRTELPALADFARRNSVRVLLVDVAEPADRVRRFFAEGAGAGAAAGPILLDSDRAAARAWGVSLLPASFLVVSGRLVLAREGEVDWAAPATLAATLAAILPPAAGPSIKSQGDQTQ